MKKTKLKQPKDFWNDMWRKAYKSPEFIAGGIELDTAKFIEDYLIKNEISEKQLARKLKMKPKQITKLLRGDIPLHLTFMAKLALLTNTRLIVKFEEKV